MTEVKFFLEKNILCGFSVSGHSTFNCDDIEGKIVCASVSSAAYMTANTITDVIGDCAEIDLKDGFLSLKVDNPSSHTVKVLEGFRLHIEQLSSDYKDRIKLNSEV